MNPDVIIVRYGELSLKSAYVRKHFETVLLRNIKQAFATKNISFETRVERGRIYLTTTDISKVGKILHRIFGIVSFSPAIQSTSTMQDMAFVAVHIAKPLLNSQKSFAVRVTRVGTHRYTSQDVAKHIGNEIVTSTHANVNLRDPDLQIFIEIREKKSFLFIEKIPGPGGLPLGTQGTILALVTKPSSLLAAWYVMRRGCTCIMLITHPSNENMIRSFFSSWYAEGDICSIDPTNIQFTQQISDLISNKKCEAVVTDFTFEEPSKALCEIIRLKEHIKVPILTPLLTMTQQEIKNQCQLRGIPI